MKNNNVTVALSWCTRVVWCPTQLSPEMPRRAGLSRRVVFRGQGEVGAKLKLDTDVRLAPFNLDLLEISSYEFSWEYESSKVKDLRTVLSEGEVPQILFKHFPGDDKVFMVAPKNHDFHRKFMFSLVLERVRCTRREDSL